MTEWETYRLGDVCSRLRSGKGIPASEVSACGKFAVVGGNGVRGYTDKSNFNGQCVVVGRQGAYCGNVRYFDGEFYMTEHAVVIVGNEYADTHFLAYLLSIMELGHLSAQSAQPGLSVQTLSKLEISLPPLEEQRRIAGILGAIDDKIENNRRINSNLELQAQALYKQWFVDNRSDDWEEKLLSEIAEFIGGYSYKGNELVEASSTAMATIKNFERKGGFKVEGFKDIVASPKLKAEQHAELFDILVAHTDLTQNADVIGNAEILLTFGGYTDIIFSMDLVKVLPKSNFPYKYLLAALLKNPYFKAHCLGYVNGTTVLHMSKKALPEYVVACPPNSEAEKMDRAFKVYYHKMAEILQENETLATLRDTLLPKLMNGEIKLPNNLLTLWKTK